ncbi:MAG: metal ABC transporter ATP-binding protein [Bacillota bacterium]
MSNSVKTDNAVEVDQLNVKLNQNLVLEDITFHVKAGEFAGIIGPNGAGKTTLLRAMLGLVPIWRGEFSIFGLPMSRLKEIRSSVGYMPQRQSFERRFPLSVADVVATGLISSQTLLRKISGREKKIRDALRAVRMESFYSKPFQDLSGGEQQRVLLARSLAGKPRLLLLDEPNAGLDFPAQQSFLDILKELKERENLTIILVSHDLFSIAPAADNLICINRTMHVHGKPAEVLQSSHLDQAYRCQFDYLSGVERKVRWDI